MTERFPALFFPCTACSIILNNNNKTVRLPLSFDTHSESVRFVSIRACDIHEESGKNE